MSDPALYCNACGREIPIKRSMGNKYRCRSSECLKEMSWRDACHILGRPYRPSPETEAWARRVLDDAARPDPKE